MNWSPGLRASVRCAIGSRRRPGPLPSLGAGPMFDITVPVLIVGGGGCGLTTSIFLSEHGIEHLVERHVGTSRLPKAHGQAFTLGSPYDFADMIELVSKCEIDPLIDTTYPLPEIAAARTYPEFRAHLGKIDVTTAT
jgi:hypothetical protein